jgi:hypothetical protein
MDVERIIGEQSGRILATLSSIDLTTKSTGSHLVPGSAAS